MWCLKWLRSLCQIAFLKQALTSGSTEKDHAILLLPSALRSYPAGFSSLFSRQAANSTVLGNSHRHLSIVFPHSRQPFPVKNLKNKNTLNTTFSAANSRRSKTLTGEHGVAGRHALYSGVGEQKKSRKRANKHHFKCIIVSNAYTNAISTHLLDLCPLVSQVSVASVTTVIKNDANPTKQAWHKPWDTFLS